MTHYTEDSICVEIQLIDHETKKVYNITLYICAKLSKDSCEIKVNT